MHVAAIGGNIRFVARPKLNLRSPWLLLPLAAASVMAASLIMGALGVVVGLAWFLFLAARFDNHTGSCFMVAVLVVVVLVLLTMLIGMMARFARAGEALFVGQVLGEARRVPAQVLFHEGRDEIVAVVVARVAAQRQRDAGVGAGALE